MNTAHKEAIPTLLPSGQVETRAGTVQQPSPGTKPTFGFYTMCRQCRLDPREALELENTRNTARQPADWLALTAIGTFTQSKVVFEGSLAAELKLSKTSARSSPECQAYAFTQSGYTHTEIHTGSSGTKTGLRSFPRRPSPFPDSKTSCSLPRLLS